LILNYEEALWLLNVGGSEAECISGLQWGCRLWKGRR